MTTVIEPIYNMDDTFSHFSLIEIDDEGECVALTTGVVHNTREEAQLEMVQLGKAFAP